MHVRYKIQQIYAGQNRFSSLMNNEMRKTFLADDLRKKAQEKAASCGNSGEWEYKSLQFTGVENVSMSPDCVHLIPGLFIYTLRCVYSVSQKLCIHGYVHN